MVSKLLLLQCSSEHICPIMSLSTCESVHVFTSYQGAEDVSIINPFDIIRDYHYIIMPLQ